MVDETNEEPKKLSILEQTNEAIKKLEEQNTRMENNITQLANEKLGGTTGGNVETKPPVEISDVEYAKAVMEGKVGDGKTE